MFFPLFSWVLGPQNHRIFIICFDVQKLKSFKNSMYFWLSFHIIFHKMQKMQFCKNNGFTEEKQWFFTFPALTIITRDAQNKKQINALCIMTCLQKSSNNPPKLGSRTCPAQNTQKIKFFHPFGVPKHPWNHSKIIPKLMQKTELEKGTPNERQERFESYSFGVLTAWTLRASSLP